jgi:hypothetical protein
MHTVRIPMTYILIFRAESVEPEYFFGEATRERFDSFSESRFLSVPLDILPIGTKEYIDGTSRNQVIGVTWKCIALPKQLNLECFSDLL